MRKNIFKTLLFTFGIISVNVLSAQVTMNNIDQRLIDVYGESRIQELIFEQPQFIDYMNYYVKNGYQILYNVPERKLPYFKDISTISNSRTREIITPNDLDNLNILLLDIQRKQDEHLTYKVGDSGTVVVFVAPKNVLRDFNALKEMEGKR